MTADNDKGKGRSTRKQAKRPEPAKPGVIARSDIGAGKPAQAGQPGEIRPIDSTILGDEAGGRPAAEPKPDAPRPEASDPDASKPGASKPDAPVGAGTGAARQDAGSTANAVRKDDAPVGAGTRPPSQPMPAGKAEPTAATPLAQSRRRGGFWPLALGGAVAAGLGAVAAVQVLPHLPPEWRPAAIDRSSEVEGQAQVPQIDETALLAAAEEAGARAAREVLAEQPRPDALPAEGGLDPDAEAAEPETPAIDPERVDDLAERLAALEQQLAAIPAPLADDQAEDEGGADADATAADGAEEGQADLAEVIAALQAGLAEQQELIEAQRAEIDDLAARPSFDAQTVEAVQSRIDTAAAEVEARLAQTLGEAESLQAAAAESTRRAEAVAAIASLQSALDRGVTPEEARSALTEAGITPPEALARPVPSLASLQADFPEAARAALRADLSSDSASGQGNLIGNFLRAQTGARSVAPREGADADAILSRANAQVEAGEIGAALTELGALSAPARAAPAMEGWLASAQAYANARAALSDLTPDQN